MGMARFPLKNKLLLSQWIASMKRDKWQPSATDLICSEHFEESCFRFYNSQTRLKEDAVPSIFKFPQHLQKVVSSRRVLVRQNVGDVGRKSTSSAAHPSDDVELVSASPVRNFVLQHHNYAELSSPCGIKRKYDVLLSRERIHRQAATKRLKVARRRLFRQQTKLKNMSDIIKQLKSSTDISSAAVDLIENCFGNIPAELLKRKLNGSAKDAYSDVVRSFAMTLHFYSAKAYSFIRSSFSNTLPHPSTLRKWSTAVDGKPGFTEEAFECLRRQSSSAASPLLCCLIFDEMAIRKHVRWNGQYNEGFVDMGTEINDDSMPVATEALMFLLAPLNAVWKLPIAYFLTDGLSADVKANIVLEAIKRLHDVNVRVTSIVCDGPSTNFAVGTKLGASLTAENMNPRFPHPTVPDWNVYVIFDAAHMLKLMRNTLADKGSLTDKEGKQIRWQYLKDLYEIQDKEGLKAANKLKKAHIEWYSQKMKVSLAAQSFSRSVAAALEFVSHDLNITKFRGVEATVRFIRIIDRLFDALNSKNPFAKEFKSVLRMNNEKYWRPFLNETIDYLLSLKLDGRFLHETARKTTVLGFVATIKSVIGIYDEFVSNGSLPYLATYRVSQDHIELTFNVVRSRGRWNNNPTAGQFRSAYKQLLMKHDIKPKTTGNVIVQEDFTILSSNTVVVARESVVTTEEILKRYGLVEEENSREMDHNYSKKWSQISISEFSENVITYVAGYVAKKLCATISCAGCRACLIAEAKVVQNCKLLKRKDGGGLVYPSDDVVSVCKITERCIRFVAGVSGESLPQQRKLRLALQVTVIEKLQHLNLFSGTTVELEHSCKLDIFDCYRLNLIRLLVDNYVNLRFYAMGKIFTEKLHAKNVRFNSNKQVLFAHQ